MKCTRCNHVVRPAVAIDIDGTLADYHSHFHQFAEAYVGRTLPFDYKGDREYSEFLKINKRDYRDIKLAFRQGSMKRSMPAFPDATSFMEMLQAMDVEVWIATTRPYLRLDMIDPDTRFWLERNKIAYDGLIYGEEKYHKFAAIVGVDRIIGVVDDLPEMIDVAEGLGLSPIHRWNQFNEGVTRLPGAYNLLEVGRMLRERADKWRANHE